MIKLIGNNKKFVPLIKKGGKYCKLMWDKEENNGLQTWMVETFDRELTFKEIKEFIISYYNKKTDEEILTGFTWEGHTVWLSQENQANYKNAYVIASDFKSANIPLRVKFGSDEKPVYYEFLSFETLKSFYLAMCKHIQNAIENGWAKKDAVNWELYK